MLKFTRLICIIALAAISISANAQVNTKLRPDETILLYADSFEGNIDPIFGAKIGYAGFKMEEKNELEGPETISSDGFIRNISDLARMDLYFPKKTNGQMVIVCPGGAYVGVSTYNEGIYAADWLLDRNIAVCVLKYRMPNGHRQIPLSDVENAFRYCRSHAEAWGVNKIGIMGFSAGGHLAATASTLWSEPQTRPDFSILIYPVITLEGEISHRGTHKNLLGEKGMWKQHYLNRYSAEKQVGRNTPVTFLALSSNDKVVPAEHSILYYNELIIKEISVEMHIYPTGGHGWGFSSEKFVGKGKDRFAYARNEFYNSLERWLKNLK